MTLGKFVISLDFELMWGVLDRRDINDYGDAVLGVREALPEVIKLFRTHNIRATWATVGLLFARDRKEMLDFCPATKPEYLDKRLSPYPIILEGIGQNEQDDPYHFGRSLLDQVLDAEGQEIGTHTFGHYYCLESGQTLEAFSSDIASAVEIARHSGVDLKSIVFPRNQMSLEHVDVCSSYGISAFRGNPGGFAYKARPRNENSLLVRGLRFADGALPVARRMDFPEAKKHANAIDVPASRFLRPWNRRLPGYSKLHVRRIKQEMRDAAKAGYNYHLWWHPHNMGRNTAANLQQLKDILEHYRDLSDQYGMTSANMADFVG